MTYLFVLERWIFFFKARFIATICQNFNREPLLDSMVFFLVPFFSSSVWSHEPWCLGCFGHVSYYLSRERWDLYYTWVQLLHLCLPQVPLTRNPDPWSEFGLRGNQTFSLLGSIFRGVIFSHISSLTWDQDMCHLYQSVNKAKGKLENWG